MEKIYCITDVVSSNNYKFVTYPFRGHILVDDNGWFEGYIKKVGYTHTEFIFGIYHPGEILDLYLCGSGNPQIFHGKLDKKNFKGKMKFLDKPNDEFEHNISFSSGKISEEGLNDKIKKLKGRFSLACSEFYKRTYEARKELDSVLVKSYVGISFSEEDKTMARDINNKKREARHVLRKMNMKGGR